jgi:hypothetical protein
MKKKRIKIANRWRRKKEKTKLLGHERVKRTT